MKTRPRFDVWELALIAGFVLAAGFGAGRYFVLNYHEPFVSPLETEWLRQRYGPDKWSENVEEWIARDFFADERGGVFVDVGSADARTGSNTFYLESRLGWSGVAVDALEEYGPSYVRDRPGTKFFSLFVGDRSDDKATLYVSERFEQYSSATREFTARYRPDDAVAREVPTITLDDLLTRAGLDAVDFLSMDIELAEPQALAGFDVARWRPRLVCVEAHAEVRQAILDYFTARRYAVVGKYLRLDRANLWLAPLD